MIRRVALALVGMLALLGLSLPAYGASGDAQITHFEQSADGLSMLVSVPAQAQVDLSRITVTIAGQPAEATAEAGSTGDVRRTAILAIDTSSSMSGAKFAAAKSAATAFVAALPKDVYLGVVTFGGTVTTALAPTRDRAAATGTLAGLSLSGGTLLYDGVRTALDDAGTQGQRSLLVLSDGADTRSSASLSQTTAAIKHDDALVQVVAVDETGSANTALQGLARAGRGTVIPADAAALDKAFTDQAGDLARQVLVTASIPAGVTATQGTVEVTLPTSDGSTLTASAYDNELQDSAAPTPAPVPVPSTAGSGWVLPSWALYPALGAVALGLFVLVVALLPRPTASTAESLVTTYTERTAAGVQPESARGARADAQQMLSSARTAAADLLKRNATIESRIAQALDGAGSDLKPAEWLLSHVVIAFAATLLGLLLGHGGILVGLIFLALGVIGPWLYLGMRRSERRKKFAEALPDTLQLMAGSLSAGLSLAQTVDTVVREGAEPIAGEFRRALVETRLGVEVEDALDGIATRFQSPDFGWVVMAIRIQRQVGGNLAELFTTVAATLRERQYLRRQVGALSAEGRLSAYVIGALPPLFMLYLLVTNGAYLHPLFHDPRGVVMLVFGIIWLIIGFWWMSKIVKVEI
jgi:tight adherence protein B